MDTLPTVWACHTYNNDKCVNVNLLNTVSCCGFFVFFFLFHSLLLALLSFYHILWNFVSVIINSFVSVIRVEYAFLWVFQCIALLLFIAQNDYIIVVLKLNI